MLRGEEELKLDASYLTRPDGHPSNCLNTNLTTKYALNILILVADQNNVQISILTSNLVWFPMSPPKVFSTLSFWGLGFEANVLTRVAHLFSMLPFFVLCLSECCVEAACFFELLFHNLFSKHSFPPKCHECQCWSFNWQSNKSI